jgi:sigma-B regulation protein RsbU (phosphoserine phosphatase)
MEAAKDVGGDFYDFFRIDEDRIALVIGDVCGKGIPAALFMVLSQTIIRSKASQYTSAAECMTEANHLLASYSVESMFVTVFYVIYNTKTGHVTYCNAGHNPPHILRADGTVEKLPKTKNVIVGVYDGVKYKEDTLQLEHGDTLVMFTDGVTEARNQAREEFGTERLNYMLSGLANTNCRQMVETVKAGLATFVDGAEQHDDITMLVIKRK